MQTQTPTLTYWQQHLQYAPAMFTLATDKKRQAITDNQTARYTQALPVTENEEDTAATHLLAAYLLLLRQHIQQDDLIIGTPIADQLLPLRIQVNPAHSFSQFIAEVTTTCTAAAENATPLSDLVAALQPAYDDSYAPLFQLVFAKADTPVTELVEVTEFNHLHDLTLIIEHTAAGWQAHWHYRADLFTEAHIQRLALQYAALLQNIAQNPDAPIAELSAIAADEFELMVHTWNQTALDFPQDLCLHEWIAQQMGRTPEKTAVSDENTTLTYAQLDTQSSQLAAYLQEQGVDPGVVVAFYLPRTVSVLVTLLGILKAGGTYLPLTADLPPERIQFMLEDAKAKLIITDTDHARQLPDHITAVQLDTEWPAITKMEPLVPPHLPTDTIAYIIYTSGSTGIPKGVPITHRNIVHLLAAMLQEPGMTPDDKYLAITAFSFDILGYELYCPLLVGGEVVVASSVMMRDGHLLSERLDQGDITFMQSTPVTWQMLLAAGWQGSPHLKMVSCGEALTRHLATQLLTYGGELWNLYGPTEATIFATGHHVSRTELAELTRDDLPIGRPIANMETFILDENHHLLPIGAVGELYLGGAGLSPGYLYREALTAERFIPHPFAADPNAKLYRTGDLARYRPDGIIEYLGRTDYQVKVHGLRIELGEIESRAQELPEVAASVATTWVNPANNDKQLVLYFVSESGQTVDSNQIRQALRGSLPGYMVPNILMQLPKLPATPNGKVDRKALPAPNLDDLERSVPFEAPRSPIETAVCTFWQSLLGISSISIHDDFLELGAHSLQATQFISFVQEQFNVKLLFREIIEQGTIARIAQLIAEAQPQTAVPPIVPVDPAEPIPVSIAQQRLLVLDRLDPGRATYNVPLILQVHGRLDNAALQSAADALYLRHSALRTTFYYDQNGQPLQKAAAETHLPITWLDVSDVPPHEREEAAMNWVDQAVKRPFSLTQDRLIRVLCIRQADQQHILAVIIHHIITDGWSTKIVANELWQLYQAAQVNKPANLPKLPVQYGDFSAWQRRWLTADWLKPQLHYWQTYLKDAPTKLALPTDLPRPKMQSSRGLTYKALLSPHLQAPLKQLGRAQGSTLFMTLLAAYNVLLFRHSQQHDLIIGTAVANRSHPDIQHLIGFFVNMLPLRAQIQGEDTFLKLLAQVQQSTLDAHTYQDVPFEQMINFIQPERDTSYAPLVQVAFALEDRDMSLPQADDLQVTQITAVESESAKYDLMLFVIETEEGLLCEWEYCTDLFLPQTIARLHTRFDTLLQAILDNPECPVAQLPLLPEAEKQQLLHHWQGQPDDAVSQRTLSQQFETWAAAQPGATAVSDTNTTLTYHDLNGRANQLVHLFIQKGIQPGDIIGIHMPASIPAIIAIIACHKARVVYVPFDPAYPRQRLQYMLTETAAPIILTDTTLDHLDAGGCAIWHWQKLQAQLDQQPAANLNLASTTTDPAYIIYTSGSTGKPKGVVCGHAGVNNLLLSFDQWGTLRPQTASTLWTSLNFDVSVYEIFAPLTSGGSLHIVPPAIRTDMNRFFAWLAEQQIASAYLPPFMVESFAGWLQQGSTRPPLQRLLVGVEPLSEQTLVQIQQAMPGLTLLNGYGPTEATVCATLYYVPQNSTRMGNAPIGRPLLNTEVYLLDEQMQPVPVGVAGELYIGGIGLAHGYLNQPELTAEKFIPHPFTTHPQARLYRTGDMARYLPDGNIQFIGRSDFQLKVRGFRVELGEIEAQLLAQRGVSAAAVTPHTAPDGQIILAAYYVAEQGISLDTQTLQHTLAQTLPNYMVPAVWMQLEAMPRTPNDKIDRQALPQPDLVTQTRTTAYAPPATPLQEQLVALWEKLLQVSPIGIHDNFFALGGHSLLAMQMASVLGQQLDQEVPLRFLFDAPTVAGLARYLDEPTGRSSHALRSKTTSAPRTFPNNKLPLSLAQKRLWFFYKLNPASASYNIPIALRLRGAVNPQGLTHSLLDVIQRHEVLRTTYYETDDVYGRIQTITHPPITPVNLRHLQDDAVENEVMQRVEEEGKRPFTLTDQIPIRIQLLELADDHFVLLLTLHHIAFDLWSIDLLIHEVVTAYKAYQAGYTPDMPPLIRQYSDYAAWQEQWLAEHQTAQETYWQNTLTANPAPLILPADKPRPAKVTEAGAGFSFQLPASLNQQTQHFVETEKATLFMVLLAAYQALLYRCTGEAEINVGSPIANRHHAQTENLIGLFVNTIVINATIDPQMSFRQLLHQVRQRTIGAQENQDLPFNKVVDLIQPERDPAFSPLFQTLFTAQTAGSIPTIPGVKLEPVTSPTQTAKFDLTLSLTAQNEVLSGFIEYKTDLFSEAYIEQFSQHFARLLMALLQNPDQPLAKIDFRTEAERVQQTHAAETPAIAQTVIERFAEVVAQFGDKTAVSPTLTYQQLDDQSNQIAHLLHQHGIEAGDTVAIYAADTPEMITAVFGILKAGGIFLPLNQDEPAAWQQICLHSGQAKLLLYSQNPPEGLVDFPQIAVETAVSQPTTPLPTPDSGGIHLPHFGTYTTGELAQLADLYPIQPDSRVLQMAPFASHHAAHEIFATLLNGGALFLAERSQLTKLSALYDLFTQTQADFAILPAALLAALDPQRVPDLQTAVCLEADISPTHWQKWTGRQRLHGHLSAVSILPTVLSPVNEDEAWLSGMPTTAVSIQNEAGQRTPTGVVGELRLGAKQQPTGDHWCWLTDGRIQFRRYHPTHTTTYGRYVHTQQIAELFCQNTAVQECVILPDNNPAEKRQLHAYVVTSQPVETTQLEQFAQQQLPRQLVPAQFHLLAELPLTASGSVDYLALQKLQRQESQSDTQTDARASRQAELAARRDNLSAKKLALLEKWQQQKASTADDTPRIPPRPAEQPLPLSFAQQRLWFIEQLDATGASYNIPIHMQLNGPLDVAALEFSFNQLLTRHESLRTRFVPDEDDVPHQVITPYTAVTLPLTDLSKLPAAEKAAQAEKIRVQNAQTKFDLQNEPVYRIHILRLADQTHQLLFTVHHIAFDAWSTGIFLREIVTHYLQKTSGRALPLPQVNVQYGDYTVWQQNQLTDDVLAEQLAFWRDHLADAPAAIELPADMPRQQWQTSHGSLYEFDIPPAIAAQVKMWTQAEQATLFMTLLTAFNGLLYRYTNQEDIVVGTPIANRNHPDLKNLIGFFINTLALRAHIEDTTTWQELLAQTRQTMLDAQAYQDYPFENLVQALLPDRDPARHPLFQVMFVLQNQGDDAPLPLDLPIRINFVGTETKTAKFDLLLHIEETAVGLAAAFEYNTDLFLPETIERMANHFQHMVADMVTQPQQPIFQAKLLTEREEKQIATWNNTTMDVDETEMIHHRFERQAATNPNAVAVEFGDEQLTYAQLEAQANQLAHFLHQQGIANNDLVGIMLPRSLTMVTAVLGTLKAGAGYVPLDPVYPPNRLEAMMQQAGVKLLLSHSSLPKPEISCPIYDYDALDLEEYGRTPVQIPTDPEHIAYVIFTSGSTGIPKGVTLPHRALANMLAWQQQATHIKRPARTLQFTSLSFDVHFQEIFTAWQEGGTLVLIPDDVRRDGEQLLDYIRQHQIERLFLPFVALHNLAEAAEWQNSYPQSLQEVITAGEALQSTPPVRQFFTKLSHCVLHNHYGPSESHVVTQYTLGADPAQWAALPPIGTPIANTQIHLLDANMKPVPIGIPGELYIGGRNLALGYINQPNLTRERFIPDPFGSSQTGLLYKTGDLARYLPDGNIQFIGRNDFQVKIRGHRIELGEIEAVLNKHTAVEQAVVQAHKPDIGAHQLIAYIKTAQEDVIAALPAYLRERLPAYMVPAHFVRLDAFPLTSSGKINRRALPVPDKMEVVRSMPYAPPQTDLQQTLVQVWEEVLGVSPVGIHDNFFELGGHSLLALRLVAAMKKATGVKLPLPRLFQEGTIAAIAAYLDNPTAQTPLSPVVTLRGGNAEQQPLVLIHPGSGQVTPYLSLLRALPDSLPVYALQSLGLLPDTTAQTDIETMAATYLQELTAVSTPTSYHLVGWSMGGLVALEMAQQLTASGMPPASLTLIDTFAPDGKFSAPNDSVLLQWFAQDAGYLTPGNKPSLLADEAGIEAQLRHLWPQLQATGNIPPALTLPDVQQQFAVFRTNYAAMQAYQARPYSLPVHLIIAKASVRSVRNRWLGWKPYLRKRSRLQLSATHFSLLHPPHVERISQEIMQTIQESSEVKR